MLRCRSADSGVCDFEPQLMPQWYALLQINNLKEGNTVAVALQISLIGRFRATLRRIVCLKNHPMRDTLNHKNLATCDRKVNIGRPSSEHYQWAIFLLLLWNFYLSLHIAESNLLSCSLWAGIQHKLQVEVCLQWRFKSACASAQSGQSLSLPPEETLDPWLHIERPLKTQIRLRGCAGWSESSMGAHGKL